MLGRGGGLKAGCVRICEPVRGPAHGAAVAFFFFFWDQHRVGEKLPESVAGIF